MSKIVITMRNKEKVRKYIKDYKNLIKNNVQGSAGYAETDGQISDLEVAARYLELNGHPITTTVEHKDGKRCCYVTIDG